MNESKVQIRVISFKTYATMNLKFMNPNIFSIWHKRLGPLGSIIMRRIIENSRGHPLVLQSNELSYDTCFQGKLIIRPSPAKVGT